MQVFQYTAKDIQGKEVKGSISSESLQNAITTLKMQQLFPVKIKKKSAQQIEDTKKRNDNLKKKIKKKQIAVFIRQLASMLRSGLPLASILDISINQERDNNFKEVLIAIRNNVLNGNTLSSSMAEFDIFPEIVISMVEVGEANGRLDVSITRVSATMEKEMKLKAKVKGAMIYPSILLIVTVLVTLLLTFVVLPKFAEMFKQAGAELPLTTTIMITGSSFVIKYWYIVVPCIIAVVFIISRLIKNPEFKRIIDKKKYELPVIGDVQKAVLMATFCRTFAAMMESGIGATTALKIVKKVVPDTYVRECFDSIIKEVEAGSFISEAMKEYDVFTPLVVSTMKIGEESGSLNEALLNAAELYDDESDVQIQRMIATAEPAVTVFMALIVGFVVISMVQPMFKIYGVMS